MTTVVGNAFSPEAQRRTQPALLVVRGPAYGVIAECLRLAAAAPRASWLSRLLGTNPLPADARRWYRSAIGELNTLHALTGLGPEWTLMHPLRDVETSLSVDYVLIGPSGVFAVSIKDHADQVVRVDDHVISVNARRTNHLRDARLDAAALARSLDLGSVSSIVVIVNPRSLHLGKVRDAQPAEDLTVVGSEAVTPLLTKLASRQPALLDRRTLNALVLRAEAAGRWKSSSTVHDETLASEEVFNRLRADVTRSGQRRILWVGVAALAAIATFAAIVLSL